MRAISHDWPNNEGIKSKSKYDTVPSEHYRIFSEPLDVALVTAVKENWAGQVTPLFVIPIAY